jgi:hypothetical protein
VRRRWGSQADSARRGCVPNVYRRGRTPPDGGGKLRLLHLGERLDRTRPDGPDEATDQKVVRFPRHAHHGVRSRTRAWTGPMPTGTRTSTANELAPFACPKMGPATRKTPSRPTRRPDKTEARRRPRTAMDRESPRAVTLHERSGRPAASRPLTGPVLPCAHRRAGPPKPGCSQGHSRRRKRPGKTAVRVSAG